MIFNLSILDQSGPLDDVKTIKTYVIDTETMELVNPPYWPGDCPILARSPQTDQLALWCNKTQQDDNSQEFLVLEPEQAPWISKNRPDTLIDNCLVNAVCSWSQDGKYVAYSVTQDRPNSFYYTSVNNPEPLQLDDKLSYYYRFPNWSPNARFLYYSGACIEEGECPNVLNVAEQEVTWRAPNNYNRGVFGNIFVDQVVWSPESEYIAMPILVDDDHGVDEQILVFNILTQQEKLRVSIPNTDNKIQDLVWVETP